MATLQFFDVAVPSEMLCVLAATEGEFIGYSTNEILPGTGYALCHFQKTLPSVSHSDAALTRRISKLLTRAACRFLNGEQDLGMPGLREMKKSYRPAHMLGKYVINLAPSG